MTYRMIPVGGFAGTVAFALYMVTQLHAQTATPAVDFTKAAIAEVQDAQGQIVLRGEFALADEQDDDDVERKASLQAIGADADAAGEAEVEFAKSSPAQQEIELSVRNLPAGSAVTFLVDGQPIGHAAVDRSGRAELEVRVPMPGAGASR